MDGHPRFRTQLLHVDAAEEGAVDQEALPLGGVEDVGVDGVGEGVVGPPAVHRHAPVLKGPQGVLRDREPDTGLGGPEIPGGGVVEAVLPLHILPVWGPEALRRRIVPIVPALSDRGGGEDGALIGEVHQIPADPHGDAGLLPQPRLGGVGVGAVGVVAPGAGVPHHAGVVGAVGGVLRRVRVVQAQDAARFHVVTSIV